MSGRLIAPAEFSPSAPANLSGEWIAAWVDLMDACEQLLLVGLERQVGRTGDVPAAYRAWHAEEMKQHDAMMLHMMDEFQRRGGRHAS